MEVWKIEGVEVGAKYQLPAICGASIWQNMAIYCGVAVFCGISRLFQCAGDMFAYPPEFSDFAVCTLRRAGENPFPARLVGTDCFMDRK